MVDRYSVIRRMRADHSSRSRLGPKSFVSGPWSLRDVCDHHNWSEVGEHWLQCTRCWWCKPKLGTPPKLEKLPAILKGRVLPPLSGKIDLHTLYRNAGFVVDDYRRSVMSMVRVTVVQYTWQSDLGVRRCGAEVRFKEHGWQPAAIFNETALYRLMEVLAKAKPRRPRALWTAIQEAYSRGWPKPWEDNHDKET